MGDPDLDDVLPRTSEQSERMQRKSGRGTITSFEAGILLDDTQGTMSGRMYAKLNLSYQNFRCAMYDLQKKTPLQLRIDNSMTYNIFISIVIGLNAVFIAI